MRGRSWIHDTLSQFVLLVLFGACLFSLYKKAKSTPEILALKWMDPLFIAGAVLLLTMTVLFLFQIFSRGCLERFDPGDPESLRRLDRFRRFRLPSRFARMQDGWKDARTDLIRDFADRGWVMRPCEPFDAIGEKLRFSLFRHGLCDRVFLFYHPMLNVIIVDQVLKNCARMVQEKNADSPSDRNVVVFITDMVNRDEITSAGAGVVNFLVKLDRKKSLYPMLLDFDGGRMFYPVDSTLVRKRHRFMYWKERREVRHFIYDQAPEPEEISPDAPEELSPAKPVLPETAEDRASFATAPLPLGAPQDAADAPPEDRASFATAPLPLGAPQAVADASPVEAGALSLAEQHHRTRSNAGEISETDPQKRQKAADFLRKCGHRAATAFSSAAGKTYGKIRSGVRIIRAKTLPSRAGHLHAFFSSAGRHAKTCSVKAAIALKRAGGWLRRGLSGGAAFLNGCVRKAGPPIINAWHAFREKMRKH